LAAGTNPEIQRIAELYQEEGYPGPLRPIIPKREGDHWVPVASFAVAAEFRRQHFPFMEMEPFVDFLSLLNQVSWCSVGVN
jgi:hypothetical protein